MLDPSESDLILDPACGTGGFLIAAMNHVIEKIRVIEEKKWGSNLDAVESAVRQRVSRFAASQNCTHLSATNFNPYNAPSTNERGFGGDRSRA